MQKELRKKKSPNRIFLQQIPNGFLQSIIAFSTISFSVYSRYRAKSHLAE